jgi:hypothetical protein
MRSILYSQGEDKREKENVGEKLKKQGKNTHPTPELRANLT